MGSRRERDVDDEVQRRISRNENLFREANEGIKRGLWPGEVHGPVRFRCECANLTCQDSVEVPLDEYEAVRANPRHFICRPGHELPAVESIVARGEGYVVVEKLGAAAIESDILNPRAG